MKTHRKTMLASLFALLCAFAIGGVQADDKGIMNAADAKFVKQTAEAGMSEVQIATLGTQKASRQDVKDLATMLVTDHTKLNSELSALAQTKKVEISGVAGANASDDFKSLEKEETGKGFDKAFLEHMKDSHEKSISRFEGMEKDAADGELKAWISKTLPALRAHLDKVKELAAK